mgnify:CR=1 FL=1
MAGTQERSERDGGCAAFETADGDVVFYDRANGDAWIQSSYAIDFTEVHASGPVE